MSKIGPHTTVVDVILGDCPACKKAIVAKVTASVSVTATGQKPTRDDSSVVRLSVGDVKVEHARVEHDCGPQVERMCGGVQ